MKKTLIYTACVAVLCSPNALAQSQGTGELQGCVADPEDKVTNVYFGNGVGNSTRDADWSAAYLKASYKSILEGLGSDVGKFNFRVSYNVTSGKFYDVVEVLSRKVTEAGGRQWFSGLHLLRMVKTSYSAAHLAERLVGYIGAAAASGGSLIIEGSTRNLQADADFFTPSLFKDMADTIAQAEAKAIQDMELTGNLHTSYYTSDLLAGKRVFVVAHSQGNLFANSSLDAAARARPDEASSLAMIGVATPAARQFRDSFYRTAHDDRVIDALRITENVLPSNIDNDLSQSVYDDAGRRYPVLSFFWNVALSAIGADADQRGFSNHGFIDAYMAHPLPSKSDIDDEIKRLADPNVVPFPTREAGEGAIRATLTWDAQPDVDLHAFEPNGSHVYYRSRTGRSGTLDVDDTSSYGPENYFVACNKVELGTYRIGVNYFCGTGCSRESIGTGPSTANVALFLGDGTIPSPKTVVLPAPRGKAGDGSPQILFRVQVTEKVDPQTQKRSAVYTVQ